MHTGLDPACAYAANSAIRFAARTLLNDLRMKLSAFVVPLVSLLLTHAASAQETPSVAGTAPGGYTCAIGDHAGMDDDDAHTAADVVCDALATHHARPGSYDVRVGKLGSKLLLSVSERASSTVRRLFIGGSEEVPVAADRIATALVENETVADTQGADNVVSSETAAPLRKAAPLSLFVGALATQGVGYGSSMSAGAEANLELRVRKFGLAFQGRAGGIAEGENFTGFWSVGASGRYYLSDSDAAVFVGASPEIMYLKANMHDVLAGYTGLGFGGAAEVGVSFYRSSHTGALVALRADLPAFRLDNTAQVWTGGAPTSTFATTSMYLATVSMTFGVAFR